MHLWTIPRFTLAVVGLLLSPGIWVTFRLIGANAAFWPTIWTGVALSPVVVLLEFYVVRLIGLPFGSTAWLLAIANFILAIPDLRRSRGAGGVASESRWDLAAVLAVCVGVFAAYFAHRTMFGHAWMHTDVVYQLASGHLRPEEPVMAGVRLAYPWFGHVQPALFAYVLGSSPLASYVWTNAVYLAASLALTWLITGAIGGDRHAKVWSLILLLFAVNLVGYVMTVLHIDVVDAVGFRYTPWIRRFLSFEQEQTVVPLFLGLVYLAIDRARSIRGGRWVLATLLLSGVGVIYSIVLPAACAVVGASALAVLVWRRRDEDVVRAVVALLAVIVVAAVPSLAAVKWVTQDSVGGIGIAIGTLGQIARKTIVIVVVTLPLVVGAAWALLRAPRARMDEYAILALSGAASMLLFAVFQISQGGGNEYKFVFTAAAALAPLAALAASPVLARTGSRALPLTIVGLLVFAAPAFHKWWANEREGKRSVPIISDRFDIGLEPGERFARATDALRDSSPPSTMIVARDPGLHLPTLTRRVLYAPYSNEYLPGTNLQGDLMLSNVKGYRPDILVNRRKVLHDLYEPVSPDRRDSALVQLRTLGRPIGFVVDTARDTGLYEFLVARTAAPLVADHGLAVLLLRN